MKKKERERYQLERFKAVLKDFPEGLIISGKDDGTEPDFFVQLPDGLLGIELTEMYRQPEPNKRPMQADESVRRRIVERAQKLFEENGGPVLDVSVHFGMNEEWPETRVAELAPKIAKVVSDNPLQIGEHAWLENHWIDKDYFPFEINSLSVIRLPTRLRSCWVCPEASFVPEFTAVEIQKEIDRKNGRINSYQRKAPSALWLLIIRGHSGMSSVFDLASHVPEHVYVFDFDRVFLFNWFSQTYLELFKTNLRNT